MVISIIGLLSSIVLAALNDAREKANITRLIQDINGIHTALELYHQTNGDYPDPVVENLSGHVDKYGHNLSLIIDHYLSDYITFKEGNYPEDVFKRLRMSRTYEDQVGIIFYSRDKDYTFTNAHCWNIPEIKMPYNLHFKGNINLTSDYFLPWSDSPSGNILTPHGTGDTAWTYYCFPPKI